MNDVYSLLSINNIIAFDLVFYRTLGFFLVCPYFREQRVPKVAVIILSFGMAFILAMHDDIWLTADVSLELSEHVQWGFMNLVIGALTGFVLLFSLEVVRLTGKIISYAMQLSFSQMVDPSTGTNQDAISTLLYFVFSLIFMEAGGIIIMVDILSSTFHIVPLTNFVIKPSLWYEIAFTFGKTFLYGVLLALPFLMAKMLMDTGLGVISKSAPSMPLFQLGFPCAILLGLLGLKLIMPMLITDLFVYFMKMRTEYLDLFV
ncbi:Flagellar biosynthesis protein FliR [Vibrio chagasii]|nr:Flagellar biosynthesis protein FliR [Vibrio chagasii]